MAGVGRGGATNGQRMMLGLRESGVGKMERGLRAKTDGEGGSERGAAEMRQGRRATAELQVVAATVIKGTGGRTTGVKT